MIQTPIVEATQQNHHGYDHEYLTDRNVRITLAIFTNYLRHFCELPSLFVQITLAIFLELPSPPPQERFETPSPLYRITLAIWFIFPARLPGYTSMNSWNYVSIQVAVLLLIRWVTMASSCTVEMRQFGSNRSESAFQAAPFWRG